MTSPKSSQNKITRYSFLTGLKNSSIVAIINFAVLMVVNAVFIENDLGNIYNVKHILYTIKDQNDPYFELLSGAGSVISILIILLFSIVIGVVAYGFEFKKKTSNVYFSFGISRKKLFLSKYLGGLIPLLISIIVMIISSLPFNLIYLKGDKLKMIEYSLYIIAGFCILAFICYTITALICSLSGTHVEAFGISLTVLLLPTILFVSIVNLMNSLLLGNAYGTYITWNSVGNSMADLIYNLDKYNPIIFFASEAVGHCTFYKNGEGKTLLGGETKIQTPDVGLLLIWTVIGIVLLMAAIWLFQRRKAEIAEVAGTNKPLRLICVSSISLLGFSFVMQLRYLLINITTLQAFLLALIAFIILFIFFDFIFSFKIVKVKKDLKWLPAGLGTTAVICIIFLTGCFGFKNYVPDISEIDSIEMSYNGDNNFMWEANYSGLILDDSIDYYDFPSFLGSNVDYYSYGDKSIVTKLHKEIIAAGWKEYKSNKGKAIEKQFTPIQIQIKYKMKNGSVINRFYDRTTMKVCEDMLKLDDTDGVRKNIAKLYNGEFIFNNSIYSYLNGDNDAYIRASYDIGTETKVALDKEKKVQLLNSIKSDILNQSVSERYFSSKDTLGSIDFFKAGEMSVNDGKTVYISDNMKNTIKFLKDNDLYKCLEAERSEIEFMSFKPVSALKKDKYNNYDIYERNFTKIYHSSKGSNKNWGRFKDKKITDKEKLEQLKTKLRSNYSITRGGYYVIIKYKDSDSYLRKFLPYSEAPDYIKSAF